MKIQTNLKHRYNQMITINNCNIFFDEKGIAEISNEQFDFIKEEIEIEKSSLEVIDLGDYQKSQNSKQNKEEIIEKVAAPFMGYFKDKKYKSLEEIQKDLDLIKKHKEIIKESEDFLIKEKNKLEKIQKDKEDKEKLDKEDKEKLDKEKLDKENKEKKEYIEEYTNLSKGVNIDPENKLTVEEVKKKLEELKDTINKQKQSYSQELAKKTLLEIQEIAKTVNLPEEEWKNLKKLDLIKFLVEKAF